MLVDKTAVKKGLGKQRNIRDSLGRVIALEDVVGQQSTNGHGVVGLLDGLALGDVPGYLIKGIVGGCKYGHIAGRGKCLGNVGDKFEE